MIYDPPTIFLQVPLSVESFLVQVPLSAESLLWLWCALMVLCKDHPWVHLLPQVPPSGGGLLIEVHEFTQKLGQILQVQIRAIQKLIYHSFEESLGP